MGKQRILVIDDDPGIRLALALKLRTSGYDVVEASDGVEAMEVLGEGVVNLIVTDVGMPRMDGYELATKLRRDEQTQSLPLIILTAQAMKVPKEVLPSLGWHSFLTKPFSPRELVSVVAKMLDAKGD